MREHEDDPDAPWRRGFEGWTTHDTTTGDAASGRAAPIDPVTETPSNVAPWSAEHDRSATGSRPPEPVAPVPDPGAAGRAAPGSVVDRDGRSGGATGRRLVRVVAVGAVCLGAALLIVLLWPSSSEAVVRTLPLIPEGASPLWERDVDGAVDDVGVGADLVVVAAAGAVEALESSTGDRRWTTPIDGDVDRVTVVDERVLVELRTGDGRAEVRALDSVTGAVVWSSADDEGVVSVSGPDDDVVVLHRVQVETDAVVAVLDPTTGEAVAEPFTLSGVTASGTDLAVAPTSRTVAIWSRRDRAVVTSSVGSFSLRMAAPYDGAIVALDREDRVVLFDADGRRADESPFTGDERGGSTGLVQLAGVVDGTPIAVVSGRRGTLGSDSTVGYSVDGGSIGVAWERPGNVDPPVTTVDGPVALLVGPDPTSGQTRSSIIDPVDGRTIAVTDADGPREREPVLGHNAFVVAPTIGAPTRVLTAHRYDGETIWSAELPTEAAYELAHGSLVLVESSPGGSSVSLAR